MENSVSKRSPLSQEEVIKRPFHTFALLCNTIDRELCMWLRCAVGYLMSALTMKLPEWCAEAFYVLLVLSVIRIQVEDSRGLSKVALPLFGSCG